MDVIISSGCNSCGRFYEITAEAGGLFTAPCCDYYGYTKTAALRQFRTDYNLKYKHLNIIEI